MHLISIAVLVVFTACVAGLTVVLLTRSEDPSETDDDDWVRELRALNRDLSAARAARLATRRNAS